jgi:hypothetical protein
MSPGPRDDRRAQFRSRFEASLLRLERHSTADACPIEMGDSTYAQWQSRWANRRNEIVRRLEAIDSQLATLIPDNSPLPRLSVVGRVDEQVDLSSF